MPIKPGTHTTLEIDINGVWTDITGQSKSIQVSRHDSDPGTLNAEVFDATLDPTVTANLRTGRGIRLKVTNGNGGAFPVIYTGTVDDIEVTRNPFARAGRMVNVKLSAVDNVAYLANRKEPRGVGTIPDLRWLLNGAGVPFNINGSTSTLASAPLVATNDNASLWDQILVTRDSKLGYAWVDKLNAVRVYDAASMPVTNAATLTTSVYSDIDTNFTSDQIINSVVVNWRRFNIGTDTATDVPYGPYVDATSVAQWGTHSATFTIQGTTETEANIIAYANSVLARNANAELRAKSVTIPMRTVADVAYARDIDLNSRVTVVFPNGTSKVLRVIGIDHDIKPDGWVMKLELTIPSALSLPSQTPGTGNAYNPPGTIDGSQIKPGSLTPNLVNFTAVDIGGVRTSAQPTAPTGANVGDIWLDNDDKNKMYRWDGSAWVAVRDLTIADAQATATAASTAATAAQTAANGKNKVTYSTALPGTTANTAGDIWFVINAGVITAQYEGLGGTSWASRTVGSAVIANLDAGKLTAGSAFTNDLTVRSTLTLGDASNNGFIQSHNFAAAAVGVFLSKDGIVAKGGTLNGTAVTGATVTGGVIQTGTSGQRIVTRNDSNGGIIEFYSGLSGEGPGYVDPRVIGSLPRLSIAPGVTASAPGRPSIEMTTQGGNTAGQLSLTASSMFLTADQQVFVSAPVRVSSLSIGNAIAGNRVNSFGKGDFTGNTNASAQVVITHGMAATPNSVSVTVKETQGGPNRHQITISAVTSTTITFTVRTSTGGLVNGLTGFYWQAWA